MANRSRILIADSYNMVAELCKTLLETEFEVIGIVSDGRALVRAATELKPDLLLVDIAMPSLNGLDAARHLREMLPAVKLIFLSINSDPKAAAKAFRSGASAYLLKTCSAAELLASVRKCLRGEVCISSALPQDIIGFLPLQDNDSVNHEQLLTYRQREVLQLLAEGKAMKEVGDILDVTPRTVAFHKYRTMKLLGIQNTAELTKYAIRNHMVAPKMGSGMLTTV